MDQAKEKGFEITVIAVYNDPITAFKNAIQRGKSKGRWLSIGYFAESFQQNIAKLERVEKEYPNVKIITMNNANNSDSGEQPLEESIEDWRYSLNVKEKLELIKLVENEKGRIKKDQYASIEGGLREIKESLGMGRN